VTRRTREQPWGKQVVLVAQTGWGQKEDRKRSHDAGFDHHLTKPVGRPQEAWSRAEGSGPLLTRIARFTAA
jgi:CheY-like chemotaxis protein